MKSTLLHRAKWYIVAAALALLAVAAACASTDDPFDSNDRAAERVAPAPASGPSPTPPPTIPPEEAARLAEESQQAHLESLFAESLGTIKIAEWKDNKERQLENYLAGYILVYGYDFKVELVDATDDGYQDALKRGEIDLVMGADHGWLKSESGSGLVVDAGSVKEATPESRIGVYGAIKQNAPEVMEFLANYRPSEDKVAALASRITGGRTGINPAVAALTYLKRNPDEWARWVPDAVKKKVESAIQAGKTSLVNRLCIPDGGSGAGEPNCGT